MTTGPKRGKRSADVPGNADAGRQEKELFDRMAEVKFRPMLSLSEAEMLAEQAEMDRIEREANARKGT